MDWKEYEDVTKHIYETLGRDKGVTIVCHGANCSVMGRNGIKHQIDVLTQHSDGLHSYKTAIECKYWDTKINKDIVMKVASIVEDANLNKGVIVSKSGFTPDAVTYAQTKNIGLVELREMEEKDWGGRIKNIVFESKMLNPKITGVSFNFTKPATSDIPAGELDIDLLEIKKDTGEVQSFRDYVNVFIKDLCRQEENVPFTKAYEFDKGTSVVNRKTKSETKADGLSFSGFVMGGAITKIEIKGEDHVWLIMKSIFEDKSYLISPDLSIRERRG